MFIKQGIRSKLLLSYLVPIFLIVIIGGIIFNQSQNINVIIRQELPPAIEDIKNSSYLDSLSQVIKYYDEVLTQSARNYAFTGKERWRKRYIQIVPLLDDVIKDAIHLGDKDDRRFFSGVDKANLALVEIEKQALDAVDQGNKAKAIELLESNRYWQLKSEYKNGLESYIKRRGKNYEEVLTVASSNIEELLSTLKSNLSRALYILFMAVLIAIGSAVSFSIFMSKKIMGPIKKLQKSAEIIGNGNLDHKVDGVKSKDEIGQLARAFDQMTDNLKKVLISRDELNKEIAVRKRSEERFRRFVDTAPDAIVIVNEDGKIELVNKQTEVLFGYTREELAGKSVECLIPKRFESRHIRHRKDYNARPEVRLMVARDADLVAQRKDGSEFHVEINLSPLETEHGQLVTAAIRDITDRKHVEQVILHKSEELKRSNQELEQFAYIASHDLQEPLRKVKTFGDRLIQKYGKVIGDQGQDYLERMASATNRMQTLINDLLTYSRVTSKAQPFIPVNLNHIVGEVLSDLEIKAEEANAQIHVDDLPTIEADPLQMRQLFQNLIGNALKFCKPKVSPVVEIRNALKPLPQGENRNEKPLVSEHVCVIRVADNGIGFEKKYKEQIFSVFQRLHGRNTYAGTGIGLAVCRKIVIRHSGIIEAESTPGEGSTFIITLPMRQPKEEQKGDA